ncbi:hypothetical protein K2Q02_02985 [Patescibacteria group bacterium]|nr:hypothetical protein [Patescibacteria group bacterium]
MKNIDHPVTFLFHVKFKNETKKIVVESNSRRCIFTVPPSFKEHDLYKSVYEQIKGWKRGVDSEKLFLDYFFCLLKTKFPARILSAYKSSDREDKIKGIDFIVRFIARPFYEPIEVRFNLKSSRHFLRKHKNDHPTVSTFVFTPFDLEDELSLKNRFFRFMLTARNDRVVHF